MNTIQKTLDAKGNQIISGTIVGMSDDDDGPGPWSPFQGLVVAPFSNIEGEEYTIAVFFDTEVNSSHFNFSYGEISDWDTKHKKNLATGDMSFLLEDSVWRNCPRVRFFRHDELVIQEAWSIKTLAERIFKNRYHTLCSFKGISLISSNYQCFLDGCNYKATRMALYNVWGSVYPMHVCGNCFSKTNGFCGDELPRLKKTFLLADGSPLDS
jgi:hypothetical protein